MFSFLLKLLLPALAFGGGVYVAHHWDAGDIETLQTKIATLQRDDARAKADAIAAAAEHMRRADAISLNSAVAEAQVQQKLADEKSIIAQEVHRHVSRSTVARLCIPYGLVRVLDAASLGADPDSLPVPAGQSDDACAPVAAADLAANVAANYATARSNAEQLNALQVWVREEETARRE
ncbi:MAG TPA: hypothetical protein VMD53_11340 [Rhizomicrobium sp.]|nr:hypothetical protein [Rhizomicrobium sp.]